MQCVRCLKYVIPISFSAELLLTALLFWVEIAFPGVSRDLGMRGHTILRMTISGFFVITKIIISNLLGKTCQEHCDIGQCVIEYGRILSYIYSMCNLSAFYLLTDIVTDRLFSGISDWIFRLFLIFLFLSGSHHFRIFDPTQNPPLIQNLHLEFSVNNNSPFRIGFSHNLGHLLNRITNCDEFF